MSAITGTPTQHPTRDDLPASRTSESDRLIVETCRKLEKRLESLRPHVVEFNLLRLALLGLESRLPGFSEQPRSKAERALASICFEPGSTTKEIAADSGIPLASLYPVLRILTDQGLAHRVSYRWYPGSRDGSYTNVLDIANL